MREKLASCNYFVMLTAVLSVAIFGGVFAIDQFMNGKYILAMLLWIPTEVMRIRLAVGWVDSTCPATRLHGCEED